VEREENGRFVEAQFINLKKGDRFKLYDPEVGDPRIEDGSTVYTALGDAYLGQNQIPTVDVLEPALLEGHPVPFESTLSYYGRIAQPNWAKH
jgi:hypothetical protein